MPKKTQSHHFFPLFDSLSLAPTSPAHHLSRFLVFFFLCNSNIKTRYHIDIIYEDEKIEVINEF